jgi:mRNA interferase RelE/StbE
VSEVVWTAPALRDLRRLDRQSAERVRAVVRRYADTQHGDVRKLEGVAGHYRLRVGVYRVIFRPEDGHLIIVVLHVGHRRDVYRS